MKFADIGNTLVVMWGDTVLGQVGNTKFDPLLPLAKSEVKDVWAGLKEVVDQDVHDAQQRWLQKALDRLSE